MTRRKTVAIIGGGFSGAAVAYHLAQRRPDAEIVVFEPRSEIGQGLAYATDDPSHRINVPATRMSLLPGRQSHFAGWIARTKAILDDPEALADDGQIYARRQVFGRYVSEHIRPLLRSGRITHVKERVVFIAKAGNRRWLIETSAGGEREADILALATTHPPPAVPDLLQRALTGDPRMIADATVNAALCSIAPDARVAIVGTGLTMADVVASLDRRGHRGPIKAFSRHGLLSRGHPNQTHAPHGEFTRWPPYSARELLRRVRRTIGEAEINGLPWQPVIDAARHQASLFWPNMPLAERAKIVRHLRAYWDVHRFRVAPQVEDIIRRRQREGTFTVCAASLIAVEQTAGAIELTLRARHSHNLETTAADVVVVTTGPAHGSVITGAPHLSALANQGLITPDPLGLGIACNRLGQALGQTGTVTPGLLVAGPLARGTFGELMGVPEVTAYAQSIASEILHELRHEQAC
jgi:uncharacterized NAD(P)/FAD-binding protein YdhS